MDTITRGLDIAASSTLRKRSGRVDVLELDQDYRQKLQDAMQAMVEQVGSVTGRRGPQAWADAARLMAFFLLDRAYQGLPAEPDEVAVAKHQLDAFSWGKNLDTALMEVRAQRDFARPSGR